MTKVSGWKRKLRMAFYVLIGFCLISFFLLRELTYHFVQSNLIAVIPVEMVNTSTVTQPLNIGGNVMNVPKNYIKGHYTDVDRAEKTLGLRVYYPEMTGAAPSRYRPEEYAIDTENSISMLLDARVSTHIRKPEDAYYANYSQKVNNKEFYSYVAEGKKYGLYYFKNTLEKSGLSNRDIYVNDLKAPTLIMECTNMGALNPSIEHTSKVATCRQSFSYKNVRFHLSLSEKWLPEWQAIETKTKALFDSFIVPQSNN